MTRRDKFDTSGFTVVTGIVKSLLDLGVDILDGTLRVGTPICVVKTDPTTGKRETVPLGKM